MNLYQTWPHNCPLEVEEPYLFGVIRSKVKVTVAINIMFYRLIIYIDRRILWCTHFLFCMISSSTSCWVLWIVFRLLLFFLNPHLELYPVLTTLNYKAIIKFTKPRSTLANGFYYFMWLYVSYFVIVHLYYIVFILLYFIL